MTILILGLAFIFIAIVILAIYSTTFSTVENPHDPNHLKDKVSPDIGLIAAKRQKELSQSRTALHQQLNSEREAMAVKAQNEAEAELAGIERQTKIVANQTRQQELKAHQTLIDTALQNGLDVPTYMKLQGQWREIEQSLKGGFIYQLQAQQHLLLLSEFISGLYEKSRQFKVEGKDREEKLNEDFIEFMERSFRERQRLLQAPQPEDASGSDEDTDLR